MGYEPKNRGLSVLKGGAGRFDLCGSVLGPFGPSFMSHLEKCSDGASVVFLGEDSIR